VFTHDNTNGEQKGPVGHLPQSSVERPLPVLFVVGLGVSVAPAAAAEGRPAAETRRE